MRRSASPAWRRFEEEVRLLVRAFGYEAETTQPSRDYGVDVVALNHRRKVVVQCKLYGKGRIGGETIMQLVGSRQYYHATDAICITTSRFTKQAREVAENQDVRLVDRPLLLALCQEKGLTVPSLTVLETSEGGVFPVVTPIMHLGRGEDNHLVVRSPLASRHHAVLRRDGLILSLHDKESTNGTFLNDERVRHGAVVNYGDEINVGGLVLKVTLGLTG